LIDLPDELGNLVDLRDFLYLHDNRLDSLPQPLAGLRKLRYLNISENRFSTFPDSVCHMASLVELRVT
jgi:Leucine-rich repeat (LRR) protein